MFEITTSNKSNQVKLVNNKKYMNIHTPSIYNGQRNTAAIRQTRVLKSVSPQSASNFHEYKFMQSTFHQITCKVSFTMMTN